MASIKTRAGARAIAGMATLRPMVQINVKAKTKRASRRPVSAGIKKTTGKSKDGILNNTVMSASKAFKLFGIKAAKRRSSRKAQTDLMARLKAHQEDIAKRVADGSLKLGKHRREASGTFKVIELINSRNHKGTIEFLVLFKDFGLEDSTWEPIDHLSGDVIKAFYEGFPTKPGKKEALGEVTGRQGSEGQQASVPAASGSGEAQAEADGGVATASEGQGHGEGPEAQLEVA